MKMKCYFFRFFFLDFQHNSLTQKNLNSKSIVQDMSTNGSQSHLKLQGSVHKNFFFPNLNANIFQYVSSRNFEKIYDVISYDFVYH